VPETSPDGPIDQQRKEISTMTTAKAASVDDLIFRLRELDHLMLFGVVRDARSVPLVNFNDARGWQWLGAAQLEQVEFVITRDGQPRPSPRRVEQAARFLGKLNPVEIEIDPRRIFADSVLFDATKRNTP
jgi:hypothetical protein